MTAGKDAFKRAVCRSLEGTAFMEGWYKDLGNRRVKWKQMPCPWLIPSGANERTPLTAQRKATFSVHTAGNSTSLSDDQDHVSGFLGRTWCSAAHWYDLGSCCGLTEMVDRYASSAVWPSSQLNIYSVQCTPSHTHKCCICLVFSGSSHTWWAKES